MSSIVEQCTNMYQYGHNGHNLCFGQPKDHWTREYLPMYYLVPTPFHAGGAIVLRPSEILLETRSARSKIWVLKLARSLEPLLGLSYRDGDQV